MRVASLHPDEAQRLQDLRDLRILDTPPEPAYEQIVELASFICDTSVVAVSLVDSERQWFKARKGLDMGETSRDVAFCSHAILQLEPLVVPDATKDERFHDNPLVTGGPGIRFYAGVPLAGHAGRPLGTLCALDSRPRMLTPSQLAALRQLAHQVECLLELRRVAEEHARKARLLAEQQAVITQLTKMRALGDMAAGIAHEINTPLAIIKMTAERLVRTNESGQATVENNRAAYQRIIGTVNRIAAITSGLLAFAADGSTREARRNDLAVIVKDVLALCREKLAAGGVAIVTEVPEHLCLVCNEVQVAQILLNLINNAFHAVKHAPERQITIHAQPSEGGFEVVVADTGLGIPEGAEDRIFEPFFTTRAVGEGTGLGLSVSRGLAEAHGGALTLRRPRGPTEFSLWLPASSAGCDAA